MKCSLVPKLVGGSLIDFTELMIQILCPAPPPLLKPNPLEIELILQIVTPKITNNGNYTKATLQESLQ
jgi:hypothetical protein